MRISEKWLKEYIPVTATASEIANALTMGGLEIGGVTAFNGDTVMDIEITSNRPDWLSYFGVARDVAAIYDVVLRLPAHEPIGTVDQKDVYRIEIADKKACPFYAGILIRGVKNILSPKDIQDKLLASGLRPVNLIVDLTNIVLYEMGQPMHAFDLKRLKNGVIKVRRALDKEPFEGINHVKYALRKGDLVICDGDRAVALAGVMGGVDTEVELSTTDVLLESAYFEPKTIRGTSRAHALSTDASYRFERKVDMAQVRRAQERFVALLRKYTTVGSVSATWAEGSDAVSPRSIAFDFASIPAYLGFDIPVAVVEKILKNLGLVVAATRGSVRDIQVPTFRSDLERPIDLIEEVARIYGYDNVPETLPPRVMSNDGLDDAVFAVCDELKQLSVAHGFYEIVPFSLIDESKVTAFSKGQESWVRVINGMSKELCLLRPSLIPGMVQVVAYNVNRKETALRFFEIGSIYSYEGCSKGENDNLPHETRYIGFAVTGQTAKPWYGTAESNDFYVLKGVVDAVAERFGFACELRPEAVDFLEDGASFGVYCAGARIGSVGKVRSDFAKQFDLEQHIFAGQLDVRLIMKFMKTQPMFVEPSRYPVVLRDIAVVVADSVVVSAMQEQIRAIGGALIMDVAVFDVFTGKNIEKGKKSVAFSMTFGSRDRTLSSDEVQRSFDAIYEGLKSRFGAVLRA